MNNTEIKEFKKYVRETLVKKYNMTEVEAHRAVRDSYLLQHCNATKIM